MGRLNGGIFIMIWKKKKKAATADKAAKAADVDELKKENADLNKKLEVLNASMLELINDEGDNTNG